MSMIRLARTSRAASALAGLVKGLPAACNEAHAPSKASQIARICAASKHAALLANERIGIPEPERARRISMVLGTLEQARRRRSEILVRFRTLGAVSFRHVAKVPQWP